MQRDPLITLTTDFGEASPYVAAMKGVILGINPAARLLDLSHEIPPQDIRHAAFFLAAAVPYFPPHTIHVVVVDPGVGTDRAVLFAEVNRQQLLAPDNGCWTTIPGAGAAQVHRVTESRFFRASVSRTFHGRDVFAPVAAHISRGIAAEQLGPRTTQWERLEVPQPQQSENRIAGEVVFIDRFGNLLTNLPASVIPVAPTFLKIGRRTFRRGFHRVRTYGEAPAKSLALLISSLDTLEVAEVQGNAAERLRVKVGTPVVVGRGTEVERLTGCPESSPLPSTGVGEGPGVRVLP